MLKTKEKESLNSFEKFLLKKGKKQRNVEIATNMLKMNLDVNTISQATSLKIEEVEELKKNIK